VRTLLYCIRGVFLLVCAGAGLAASGVIRQASPESFFADPFKMVLFCVGLGLLAITLDIVGGGRSPATWGAIFAGLIVGSLLAWFATYAVSLLFRDFYDQEQLLAVRIIAWVIVTYLCVTVILQTKDNFRFVLPYVEFYRQPRGERPILLDTSAIIDGRIADLVETGVLEAPLVVPNFVLAELQAVADSSVKTRRTRGRRGLDILDRLKNSDSVEVKMLEASESDEPVDQRLVKLAQSLDGRLLTTDINLNKTARLQGVDVININYLANALKPVLVPGEKLKVSVLKEGEEPGQGVGYLDDGTMVVVEDGRRHIGETVGVAVTSVLQTSAGRMIFAKPEGGG